jgi:carbon storage regulator CsrA
MSRLVLSRKEGEKVLINTSDGDVLITIVSVSGSLVKIAFDSPKEIPINREEIAQKKGILNKER